MAQDNAMQEWNIFRN